MTQQEVPNRMHSLSLGLPSLKNCEPVLSVLLINLQVCGIPWQKHKSGKDILDIETSNITTVFPQPCVCSLCVVHAFLFIILQFPWIVSPTICLFTIALWWRVFLYQVPVLRSQLMHPVVYHSLFLCQHQYVLFSKEDIVWLYFNMIMLGSKLNIYLANQNAN